MPQPCDDAVSFAVTCATFSVSEPNSRSVTPTAASFDFRVY
jgi:hypothetical protein